jgi:hypothetical protein
MRLPPPFAGSNSFGGPFGSGSQVYANAAAGSSSMGGGECQSGRVSGCSCSCVEESRESLTSHEHRAYSYLALHVPL